jgi:hypothetical protein
MASTSEQGAVSKTTNVYYNTIVKVSTFYQIYVH